MKTFTVRWEVRVEALTPRAAAHAACEQMVGQGVRWWREGTDAPILLVFGEDGHTTDVSAEEPTNG